MRVITTAYTVAFLAEQAFGHPTRLHPRIIDFSSFRLSTTSEYSNATHTTQSSIAHDLVKRHTSYLDVATALLRQVAPGAEFRLVDDHYVGTNGVGHVNFKQTAHGLDIDNADFNVNVYKSVTLQPSDLLKVILRWPKMEASSLTGVPSTKDYYPLLIRY
jgi:extracellular elastinolytic metalloproteinase